MSESLGLSIGVANLVATRAGANPVTRSSVLTLFGHRAPEVGLPEENPNLTEPGLVLRGFVERVGDQAPLVAADGTKYLGSALTVEALDAMGRAVGYGAPVTIAVPAYWSEAQTDALRAALAARPSLSPNGVAPELLSDAQAALNTLAARPGFPTSGVVALCDFGASGTSITLANAGSTFRQLGPTVRYREFSGDEIDQLILNHHLVTASGADTTAAAGAETGMAPVTRLLAGCRRAKEQLSVATVASLPAAGAAPGIADARLSRAEFEQLISGPLDRFAAAVADVLHRNGIPPGGLAAIATVGGGASIPLITTRLSERLQAPVFTTPQPLFSAAVGAAALTAGALAAGLATGIGPAVDVPTSFVGTAGPATEAAPTAFANDATTAAVAPGADVPGTGNLGALAWSEDPGTGAEPVPYTGPADYAPVASVDDYPPAPAAPDDDRYPAEPGPLPWYKRWALVLGVAGAGVAIMVAIILALTLRPESNKPVNTTAPQPPPEPVTTTVIGPNNSPTVTVVTPPPPATTTEPPPVTTTPTEPPTTTTEPTTTTTQPPTTTTTQPTTTAPPTTTQATTTAAPTTTRERPPFFPPRRP
ncbi:molecular chaperone [Mycobacterium kubicae]|uniref:Hsp70 family protein n=1 Tax=Mycobacterium kubicae TaxID=120959 RepID=UPI0007FE46F0|nr:Hsp70 family protein [Mycobacterium kubicae]OBF25285.1 molecular chaperone [Mycobacterium kubicae]